MNPAEVDLWVERLARVVRCYGDPEVGHGEEDKLLVEFVRAVANNELAYPMAVAQQIESRLLDVDRERWYA